MDEIRKSCQEELDKFRQQLKKARPSTDQAASGQVRVEMIFSLPDHWPCPVSGEGSEKVRKENRKDDRCAVGRLE